MHNIRFCNHDVHYDFLHDAVSKYQLNVVQCRNLNERKNISEFSRERDVAQWLECGALPMSLPAVLF